ncbi:glycoside hydrolase superfamily [Microdochium trichocladiopsis]|uniref:Beta-glucosidase cel3A n=1 Tax=Microdochium trichocladiopsis TaxID=1682393 RepID=A0A9P8Y409_9PEZI|nr:glycoside hydrolase superfamily [Microdochium trichocladiopsis]KAH7028124.1 glycoside hydrolase superfamily [Microdochium trichocladiopsis]
MKGLIGILLATVLGTSQPVRGAQAPEATGLAFAVPPPTSNGGQAWKDSHSRALKLLAEMTLQEKISMVTGQRGPCAANSESIERLGIPRMCFQDGPAGVRPALGHTQFPSGITTAATWDVELIYNRSVALAQEFYDMGVHIALGMTTGGPLGRSPYGGRNWEGWYADPYGTGVASFYGTKGFIDVGMQSCAKHYTVYEQETFRNPFNFTEPYSVYKASEQVPISSNVDDKTNHEVYLWSFAEAVRAGTTHVMCAYNSINGTHACANSESNNLHLKGELNFQGALISDWGGTWGTEGFVMGGLDLNLPGLGYGNILGNFYDQELYQMVLNGTIPESRLDDMVVRVLVPLFASGQYDKPIPSTVINSVGAANWPEPAQYRNVQKRSTVELIRKISADGTILLKNTGGLPLKAPKNIAIIGQDAGPNLLGIQGCGKLFRDCDIWNNNGTLSLGGGSGYAWPNNLITPLEAIQAKALETQALVQFVLNNTATNAIDLTITGRALPMGQPDVCLVFAERYVRENMDRNDLSLNIGEWTHSEDIILQTAAKCNNTIVVLHIPGPVIMEAWIDNPNITAVVAPLLPGEQTGPGLVDVLWGHVSPSAKLPFTIAKAEKDYPPNTISYDISVTPQADFTEKLKIDYRWFDSYNITPRFEFGFGLSYSTFAYSEIKSDPTEVPDSTSVQKTNESFVGQQDGQSIYDMVLTITAEITNTGRWTAAEVVQLYVSFPTAENQPPNVLRGFTKLKNMKPDETRTASFPIRRKDVMVWDVVVQKWRYPAEQTVTFRVGSSSRKLPLSLTHRFCH